MWTIFMIAQDFLDFSGITGPGNDFTVDREDSCWCDLIHEFKSSGYPGIGFQLQLLLATTDHALLFEKIHGIDDLVLKKGSHIADVSDTAASNQKFSSWFPGECAVIAEIANDPYCLTVFKFRPHCLQPAA